MYHLTLPLLLVSTSLAFAGSHDSHDHQALGSHVHGKATLDVVLEGSMLLASLKAPAADLVGFEHAATDETQRNKVYDMLGKMELNETLWTLPAAAECERQSVQVEHELLEASHDNHDHDHDHDHEMTHSDIFVDYHYECNQPEQLNEISVNLFSEFKSLHDIQGQLITPKGQRGQTLSAEQTMINLNE